MDQEEFEGRLCLGKFKPKILYLYRYGYRYRFRFIVHKQARGDKGKKKSLRLSAIFYFSRFLVKRIWYTGNNIKFISPGN